MIPLSFWWSNHTVDNAVFPSDDDDYGFNDDADNNDDCGVVWLVILLVVVKVRWCLFFEKKIATTHGMYFT